MRLKREKALGFDLARLAVCGLRFGHQLYPACRGAGKLLQSTLA